ncbi:MAG TPA: aminoacyl-tRNA hydrolase [Chloroflexota bacterium]|nr:aminoacyl-tRNA hydrolase [Chloroflexota bacterium]
MNSLLDSISRQFRRREAAPARALVVGLGNPGARYAKTRHNIGFMCVNRLAHIHGLQFRSSSRDRSDVAQGIIGGIPVVLAQPQTFMNDSGQAVVRLCRHHGVTPEGVILLYDDLDLPFATVRVRAGGSAGGHRGVQSVIDHLGSREIPRVRVGIGRGPGDPIDYVLSTFRPEEVAELESLCDSVAGIVEFILREGVQAAMNRYNGSAPRARAAP